MRVFVLAFTIGVWLVQQQAELVAWPWLAAGGAVALPMLMMVHVLRVWGKSALVGRCAASIPGVRQFVIITPLLIAGFALGFLWASACAYWRLAEALPAVNEGRDIEVVGVVSALPQQIERGMRFEFDVESAAASVPQHISLAWYRGRADDEAEDVPTMPLHAGERWRFTVRLKRPHGNVNPQGFDYEAWLFERGIRATGYVRPHSATRLNAAVWRQGYAVEMLRERIRERFQSALPDASYAGILIALAIGDQQSIAPTLWQQFAKTGITHLMSISGLHVTMFAGLFYWLVGWLWRRSAVLPLHLPAQKAAALGGFIAALIYSLLAGFAVPAQRTLYMLGVVALARLLNREVAASRVLALALLVVLILDPWAVLAAGFWLSFGAVALLFYIGSGRLGAAHWLAEWGRAQWAVTLGMLPALLALFQQFSLVSPLANAVAIPLVSFVITPLALAGVLPFLDPLLWLANFITTGLMRFIDWLAVLPMATWQQAAPPAWAILLALGGGVWLLLPRGFPARWLGLLTFLPLLIITPPRPPLGEAEVVVLDVGQGLAIHVQTATHDLLFDTGPTFSAEADSGNRIIVPYLRAIGVRRLDELIVSHADNDHSGGAESILAAVPVSLLRASLPAAHPLWNHTLPNAPCRAGDAWDWDGVHFLILHPAATNAATKSNAVACVLAIDAHGRRVLITSDIEAAQESALVTRQAGDGNASRLAAEVLIVPHHGSRTSSTDAFVAAVGAKEAIFPVGYRNRFGHPKAEIVARYEHSGAHLHRTDADGAVAVHLTPGGVRIDHARTLRRRYWQSMPSITATE
ncbi:competence protein ComEC [Rugosibacter aromaticivorans]|uniref:Competence protein ComEC n=1 Tax=Rugosibacter aromaticivorans TaxID=1565605 RepID=A0A0C5J9L0_9PROT|nr:DNA internalization-related competence protein ComEC/Rec2 [Rugosibacter aromaticivorans]AJP48389.1 competence protein ComEC [Rugosibacter aromaticivorans]TBR13819.1 MAG: DNA internalization-related competence protein ComEC/Rec2 [Rugosibacter sp.]